MRWFTHAEELIAMPVFYEIPASELVAGTETDDGQEVLDVAIDGDLVTATVYAPRPDDPAVDADNRANPESRIYSRHGYVRLGVFLDTPIDLSRHPQARNRRDGYR